jgi:hypothetical protein
MRLRTPVWILGLGLALLLAPLCPASGWALVSPVKLGLGFFGGYGFPVVQNDVGSGAVFGGQLRADVVGPLGAELSYTSFPESDVKFDAQIGQQTTKGWSQSVLALNILFRGGGITGFSGYLTAGAGSYTMTKKHSDDLKRMGYNAGLGLEFRTVSGISLEFSGRAHAAPMPGGGAHKFATATAGINFYFLR